MLFGTEDLPIVQPTAENIQAAAEAILRGELVVMPTETVYGIAGDATNSDAIAKIYEAKQRPEENPLIVHIADYVQLEDVVRDWNKTAETLANRFWPGPLTLVLKKAETIPDEVTGGLNTVAVRMPDHPVALELIEACGVPLAAPSANRFMQLSATRADHVDPELGQRVAMILDGGPCRVGLESTVIDVSSNPPRILRPGGVSRGDIQAALGRPLGHLPPNGVRRSPGLYARHYAPKAPVEIVDEAGSSPAALVFGQAGDGQIRMPDNPGAYAAALYAALYRLDSRGVDKILIQRPPEDPE